MPGVEIYTWQDCPYCNRAKEILDKYHVKYTEHKIDNNEAARDEMSHRCDGRRSVPQILKDDEPIGGCYFLRDLDEIGGVSEVFADYVVDNL